MTTCRRSRAAAAAGALAVATAVLVGCGTADPELPGSDESAENESTTVKSGALMEYPTDGPFPLTEPVHVCFQSRSDSIEAQWVKEAVAASWAAVTQLGFVYVSCVPNVPRLVRINWMPVPSWANMVGGQQPAPHGPQIGGISMTLWYCDSAACYGAERPDNEEVFRHAAAHEFGHALNFAHEHQRANTPPDCVLDQNDGNSVIIPNGIYLTPYFDRDSIMNDYCNGPGGKQNWVGYYHQDRLSPGDIRGSQTIYKERFAYWQHPVITAQL